MKKIILVFLLFCFIPVYAKDDTFYLTKQKGAIYYDERFLTFITTVGDEETIRLICLDASEILSKTLSKAHASILFSATLTPLDYFSDVLGGGKGAVRVSLPSPFDPSKLCIVGATSISTRYDDRGNSYKKLVSYIQEVN